jgi:hypothetical protein
MAAAERASLAWRVLPIWRGLGMANHAAGSICGVAVVVRQDRGLEMFKGRGNCCAPASSALPWFEIGVARSIYQKKDRRHKRDEKITQ